MPEQVEISFSPAGKSGRFPVGTAVLLAARQLGVDIDCVCGGRARCGRCQVRISEAGLTRAGVVSESAHLSGLSETERICLRSGRLRDGNRLSCQARVLADVVVEVPVTSQVHQQVVRKDFEAHDIALDPVIRLYFTEVEAPDLKRPVGDQQRLQRALETDWGLAGLVWDFGVLQTLQQALREGQWQVTVAVRDGRRVVAVWPGLRERVYGAAVDVGSTTIAVDLCDLSNGEVLASAGALNPQIRFGEDLMSRVSWAMLNPDGARQMSEAVRKAVTELICDAARQAQFETVEVLELTLVGNPVMHHLLLGLDPVPLGSAPFALASDQAIDVPAADIGIKLHPQARAYLLPCIAGYVGADAAAVLLAETPWEDEAVSLLIDVGTNAEIVLGNRGRLLAASSPTGPAFEGGQISGGQRAAPGAIERVRIDTTSLEPRYKVVGCEYWSDEAGFSRQVGERGVTGICGSGIIEVIAGLFLAGVIRPDGVIDGAMAQRSTRIQPEQRTFSYLLYAGEPEIRIRQGDVRAIQLAKAALYAGAQLLMERMGVDKVDRIRLAGAFGSQIDTGYAMVLGMLPDCDLERVSSAGNAAGTGARIALLNKASRQQIEKRVRRVEKVETAVEERFQQYFVAAMGIPHSTHTTNRDVNL